MKRVEISRRFHDFQLHLTVRVSPKSDHKLLIDKLSSVTVGIPFTWTYSLDFIIIAELAIRRLSADRFQVERHFIGRKTDLGPMSEANLEAYLKDRGLVDVMPEQVMHHLEDSGEASIRMAASIERAAAASR